MKLSKFFTFTMAALALGACSSNDDDLAGGTNPAPGKGEIIDAISIAFSSSTTSTRANMGTIDGTGSENNVYVAYVFARENDPQHEGKKLGDWTVKRVAGSADADDADVTTAIADGDVATPGTKGNMCTFNGVQQGDSVYVIANDPSMNMATANTLAHQGQKSEESIRAYVSTLAKDYLNGLTVAADGTQAGKFIMGGAAAIPTNPNTPNGGTVIVPVSLDREVAKVFFNASVSTDPQYEATGNMTLKDAATPADADGILVTRIPTRVSPFAKQARDWYFPLSGDNTTKDWDVAGWLNSFDGDGESVPGTAATADVVAFNKAPYQSTAKEYRLTWKVKDVDASTVSPATATSKVYINGGKLYSPYFYVTPNYANHSGCGTVIVTQATYTGANTLLESTITAEMLAGAVADATFAAATKISKVKDIKVDTWNTQANIEALATYLASVPDYADVLRGATTLDDQVKAISVKPNDKRYYRADVANMTADNATSMKLTERNTFYHITGTITTMGAKSIEDAINSDDINMIVQVVVKKWNYVVNNVNM